MLLDGDGKLQCGLAVPYEIDVEPRRLLQVLIDHFYRDL
jgi:hypothetical protein